jgi:MoaA/NifB/PqqE/SkfB family radical SAM enzyme
MGTFVEKFQRGAERFNNAAEKYTETARGIGETAEKLNRAIDSTIAVGKIISYLPRLKGFEGFNPSEADDFAEAAVTVFKGIPKPVARKLISTYSPAKDLPPQEQAKFRYLEESTREFLLATLPILQEANPMYLKRYFRGPILKNPGKIRGYAPAFERRKRQEEKLGIAIPWVLALDVTNRCNVQPPCQGCYAFSENSAKEKDPSFEDLDKLVGEAQHLGISNVILLGGEPLLRRDDLIELQRRHKDLGFLLFTNGRFLDKDTIKKFLNTGASTYFFLHIQGGKELTEKEMGPDVFEYSSRAMANLREAGIPFGFSTSVTRDNFHEVTSPDFLDFISSQGAIAGLYFPYVALGYEPDRSKELTPEQRQEFKEMAPGFRRKGILAVNPEEIIAHQGGCVASWKYVHVDYQGRLKPCVFIDAHDGNSVYADGMSLTKALTSPFMRGCQRVQSNPYPTSCLARDRREDLRKVVEETGAYSSLSTSND